MVWKHTERGSKRAPAGALKKVLFNTVLDISSICFRLFLFETFFFLCYFFQFFFLFESLCFSYVLCKKSRLRGLQIVIISFVICRLSARC